MKKESRSSTFGSLQVELGESTLFYIRTQRHRDFYVISLCLCGFVWHSENERFGYGVAVLVGVSVNVAVGVAVDVGVGVSVGVEVTLGVKVIVGVNVVVGGNVFVAVGGLP